MRNVVRPSSGLQLGQLQPLPRARFSVAARCDLHKRCSRQRQWNQDGEDIDRVSNVLVRWLCRGQDIDALAEAKGLSPSECHMKCVVRE